jgi:tyrosyl-tRNA synthetase
VTPVPPPAEALELLTAGAVQVERRSELAERLGAGRPLRVKFGVDPTSSDLHLGHAVPLRALRRFQELGHVAVLIVGDFTAQVGDPSGRSATRPRLTAAEVEAHAATYLEQARRILLPEPLEIRRNSEWLGAMGIDDVLRLTARTTVAQMLQREDFARRHEAGAAISVMELLYPLLQGWDSVVVAADVELGGTDQLFNLLVGRQFQEQEGQAPQVVMTLPLLVGLDGQKKMSKSYRNAVGITDPPGEQFGKLMRVPDGLLAEYVTHATTMTPAAATQLLADVDAGRIAKVDAKRLLARTVVDLYHGVGAGAAAEGEFDRVFKAHEVPADVPEHVLDASEAIDGAIRLATVLRQAGLVPSNKEGGRMITQGGVRRDGVVVEDPDAACPPAELDGVLLQVGRRRWVRIRVGEPKLRDSV